MTSAASTPIRAISRGWLILGGRAHLHRRSRCFAAVMGWAAASAGFLLTVVLQAGAAPAFLIVDRKELPKRGCVALAEKLLVSQRSKREPLFKDQPC